MLNQIIRKPAIKRWLFGVVILFTLGAVTGCSGGGSSSSDDSANEWDQMQWDEGEWQ